MTKYIFTTLVICLTYKFVPAALVESRLTHETKDILGNDIVDLKIVEEIENNLEDEVKNIVNENGLDNEGGIHKRLENDLILSTDGPVGILDKYIASHRHNNYLVSENNLATDNNLANNEALTSDNYRTSKNHLASDNLASGYILSTDSNHLASENDLVIDNYLATDNNYLAADNIHLVNENFRHTRSINNTISHTNDADLLLFVFETMVSTFIDTNSLIVGNVLLGSNCPVDMPPHPVTGVCTAIGETITLPAVELD